jgi:sugar-specific transcriptional regulator TrmB
MSPTEVPEDVEVLENLGLRLSEAKIFSALSELGPSTASTISKSSGVAREFVYQIMPRLVKRGLVEVIITVPKKFKAIAIEEAYKTLLRRNEEENRRLHLKAMKALKKRKNKINAKVTDNFQTSLVPSLEAPDTRIDQEFQSVKKSVDLTFPAGKFLQWSKHYADLTLKEVVKRNLKVRIITQQQLLKIFATHPKLFTRSFKAKLKRVDFRYVQNPFSVEMMLFDKKTLFISTKKEHDINRMVWLRTNNPLIVEMANGYFEAIWEKAAKG